ncbi:DUF899 family protein [Microlunatus sp. GCM10028923]|uniref:DUF899 family protein n=1 Tax=Microlunatus sp. GCM10028923 TaxID=3273400 RepID=UPI003618448B
MPEIVDRATWQAELDRLQVREKAHTREGDAIAAARRRLPMIEIDPRIELIGENGPVPLIDTFEGRRQLLVYFHMWHHGHPAPEQCEGCTFFTSHALELSYLHSRDVTYATFCQGSYPESSRYKEFMGWTMPWYSARDAEQALLGDQGFGGYASYLRDGDRVFQTYWSTGRGTEAGANSYHLLDLTVYGRQESWEDSPAGWPQPFAEAGQQFRTGERPTSQWSRIEAGRSDDLTGTAS